MLAPRPTVVHQRTLQLGLGWFPQSPGGVNRFYYDLVHRLPGLGIEVQGFVVAQQLLYRRDGCQVEAVSRPSAPLAQRMWKMRSRVNRASRNGGWATVGSHFALYTFPVLDLLRHCPLIVHFQGPWALETLREGSSRGAAGVRRMIEQTVYRRASRFITLSTAFKDLLHQLYLVDEQRIHVIPGGVDSDRFASDLSPTAAREVLGWPSDRPIVLSVRRLVRRMGLENVIAAAGTVIKRFPETLFLIAGHGVLAHDLEERIIDAGLSGSVRLIGRLPDDQLPLAYRASDLTLVPSVALEGFGLIVPESLAAGTPVLVTPVGGLPEIVRDLAPDLILPDISPAAIAAGVIGVLDGTLKLPTATTCQEFARHRYDWSLISRRIADVYEHAMR
jgi:glycogen(starch) synthase